MTRRDLIGIQWTCYHRWDPVQYLNGNSVFLKNIVNKILFKGELDKY